MLVTVTLKCSVLIIVTVTLQCSGLLMVTVTLQCLVLLMVTVTLKCLLLLVVTHPEVFSAPYGHSLCSVQYSLWSLSLCTLLLLCSGNERPCTASCQNDAAASHSCHFNTVLYPRSYSECQLPLNHSRRYIPGAAFSVQNYHKIFAVTALSSLAPLHTCQHIMLYNVPL
jgi:hypothetical protein